MTYPRIYFYLSGGMVSSAIDFLYRDDMITFWFLTAACLVFFFVGQYKEEKYLLFYKNDILKQCCGTTPQQHKGEVQ